MYDLNLTAVLRPAPTDVATAALLCPTLCFLNKNYLLRFEISILSSSVTLTYPSGPAPKPINENILMYSHPNAPAPTMNALEF